ncbi:MAG: RIP metalloprotease RseP [Gemmatimonadota bacterium]
MLITILATIVVLGVLILVHELGHYWAAKAVDIEVSRFSIGFGPKLVGFRRGETEYVISALPLGGYVKMEGMADEEAYAALEGGASEGPPRQPSSRDFDAKPLWARTIVILAGVTMNILFAFLAFTAIARTQGVPLAKISEVAPDTPAEAAGLVSGDEIIGVAGDSVADRVDAVIAIQESPGQPLDIVVLRDEQLVDLVVTPAATMVFDDIARDSIEIGRIGVVFATVGSNRPMGLLPAISLGADRTVFWATSIGDFLRQLFTGQVPPGDLGGPIMIGQLSGEFARSGFWSLLNFMAILSVNLAVLNLLPIPVLDGGHLLFLGMEAVRGRAMSLEGRLRLTQLGFLIVLGLMVWAFSADIVRLFKA